ncbi:MAG: hypothetical protein AB7G68_13410 [Nitrospiraceae bacterium]
MVSTSGGRTVPLRPAHAAGALFLLPFTISLALAVPMEHDPNGFEGLPWGADCNNSATFVKIETTGWIETYERTTQPAALGPIAVDQVRFMTVDGKLARVTVRYHGKSAHNQILIYLQQQFGLLDHRPGQIAAGAVKLFDWRGLDTEIILRYESRTDEGIIFFESQTFRAKLLENNSGSLF